MSILKPLNTARSVPFSVRVPAALHAEVQQLQADAAAAGLQFDTAECVIRALQAAVRAGRSELPQTASRGSKGQRPSGEETRRPAGEPHGLA